MLFKVLVAKRLATELALKLLHGEHRNDVPVGFAAFVALRTAVRTPFRSAEPVVDTLTAEQLVAFAALLRVPHDI